MAGSAHYLFSLLCLCILKHVLARNCDEVDTINNCNECIRCGGTWCNDPEWAYDAHGDGYANCIKNPPEDWCLSQREILHEIQPSIDNGNHFTPRYKMSTAQIDVPVFTHHKYFGSGEKRPKHKITNSSQGYDIHPNIHNVCDPNSGECKITIETKLGKDFCYDNGTHNEYISLNVRLDNIQEEVDIKYHVPCACACSQTVEVKAKTCNYKGNYSCGVCSCEDGWLGSRCELSKNIKCPERGDGDDPCSSIDCSGNGYCECGDCVCDFQSKFSRYFESKNSCQDICTTFNNTNSYCIINSNTEECNETAPFQHVFLNSSNLNDQDEQGRWIWINCTLKTDTCDIKYAAMRKNGVDFVMMIDTCRILPAGVVSGGKINVIVPVVLSLLALVSIAGVYTVMHILKNRKPPLLSSNQYNNICAEEVLGENPLYKPPTTCFKNPTYGKS